MNAIVRFLASPFAPALTVVALALGSADTGAALAPQESEAGAGPANYELAARFAPYRIQEMVHSTSVDPRWIEGTDKFWYEWENADGKFFYIVDPGRDSRTLLFDNDRIAAELTRITRDPWDGQHLPIRNIRFISDDVLHFEVESSQDEEVEEVEDEDDEEVEEDQDEEEDDDGSSTRKRVHHFEYTVSTRTLRELEDYEAPDDHPDWASVSPDGETVIFASEHNLWMMSGADYQMHSGCPPGQVRGRCRRRRGRRRGRGNAAHHRRREVLHLRGQLHRARRDQRHPRGEHGRPQGGVDLLGQGLAPLRAGAAGQSRGGRALGRARGGEGQRSPGA